jgi:hypothetical protein
VINPEGTKRKAPASEGLTVNLKKKKTTPSSVTEPQNVAKEEVTENTLVGILDKVFGCMDQLQGSLGRIDSENIETEKTQLLLEASSVNVNLERMKSLATKLDAKLGNS